MKDAVYHQYARTLKGHWWVEHRRAVFRHWLQELQVQPSRQGQVLELGCSVGAEFDFFAEYGAVTGVELSPVALSYARNVGYQRLLEADLNDVALPDAHFDLAADFHVLYHEWVRDPGEVLMRVRRSLKPGGRLLLSEPAFRFLTRAHDEVVMGARRWTRSELLQLVQGAGFEVERFSALLSLVAPAAVLGAWFDRFRPAHADIRELEPSAPWVDRCLRAVMAAERALIRRFPLPAGTCWALVARRVD